MRARALLATATLAVASALTACSSDEPGRFTGQVLDNPYTVPDTSLTDTDGRPFSLASDTEKRLTMVFFGYVGCVDVCPAVLNNLAAAMTRLDEADREDVEVVLVTSDPDTDTPESLRDYLDRFDPSFIGLDGDFDTIAAVGRELAVGIDRQDPGGHTTQVMGIDSDDQSPVYWRAETSPTEFADDIHTLLEES